MKKVIIVIVFVISIVVNFLLLLPYIETEENVLENNKIDRDKTYAIMVQNEDKSGYIESTSNTFPSNMTLNEELTNCVDESGTKVDNPFTYENGVITVRTSKKIYCYLYFDVRNEPLSSYLISNPTSGLNTTLEGGLYRYQGTSVDNYICFGTSDKDTCLANTDKYMYRIIGVNLNEQVQLIKKEALESTMKYHVNNSNITWPNSDLYKAINGYSYLNNTTYVPNGWKEKIETKIWKYGDNTNFNLTAEGLYNIEHGWSNTTDAQIGLMYAYDYAYTYQSGGLDCSKTGSYSTCKTSWVHISVNDSSAPSQHEWTMSRYGVYSGNSYCAWPVYSDGSFNNLGITYLASSFAVRPVFYLKSTVQFEGGSGTASDPFIIS